ncbi:DoxX family protein [Candidatus Peregrinibacteria bacterium]|nr:MAG: DoxX family protein [Candidatus Peregrinibacteria bacterium]
MKKEQCPTNENAKNMLLRIAIGGMLLLGGWAKFGMGTAVFVDGTTAMFANSVLPMVLVKGFLTALPLAEVVIGLMLLLGLFTRYAAMLAGLLFSLFVVGLVSTQDQNAGMMVMGNMIYLLATFKLMCVSCASKCSLDSLMMKK